MGDDIVTRLRNHANWLSTTEVGEICDKAADEIERLRIAGDALARAYRVFGGLDGAYDTPLHAWEEARRG